MEEREKWIEIDINFVISIFFLILQKIIKDC